MTLTTEQLSQIKADIAARKAMPEFGESIEGNIERLRVIGATRSHFSTEAVEMLVNALDELSANREAQPVALIDRRPVSRRVVWRNNGDKLPHGTELFTAPQAPAVPNEMPDAAYAVLSKACGDNACLFADELWNACRAAMLAVAPEGGN